jgi:hypothetical protein
MACWSADLLVLLLVLLLLQRLLLDLLGLRFLMTGGHDLLYVAVFASTILKVEWSKVVNFDTTHNLIGSVLGRRVLDTNL